jgi:hypothetical protein
MSIIFGVVYMYSQRIQSNGGGDMHACMGSRSRPKVRVRGGVRAHLGRHRESRGVE